MRDSFPWCQTCQSAGCSHCKEYNAAGFQAPQADPRNSPTWAPCSCGGSAETGHMPTCRKFRPARETGVLPSNPSPMDKIIDRIAELERIKANYLEYLHCRISESDWHGAWDASVNISETECEMAGLRFALEAIG